MNDLVTTIIINFVLITHRNVETLIIRAVTNIVDAIQNF